MTTQHTGPLASLVAEWHTKGDRMYAYASRELGDVPKEAFNLRSAADQWHEAADRIEKLLGEPQVCECKCGCTIGNDYAGVYPLCVKCHTSTNVEDPDHGPRDD